jgi:hypothetical protein
MELDWRVDDALSASPAAQTAAAAARATTTERPSAC